MLIDLRACAHALATLGFLVLFPAFFIYHYLLSTGTIVPIFGGMFGNVAILIVMCCAALSFWLVRARAWGGLDSARLFFLAWLYFLIWSAVGALTVIGEGHAAYAIRESIAMLVYWLAMFFIGSFAWLHGRVARTALTMLSIGIFVVIAHAVISNQSLLGLFWAFSPDVDAEVQSITYQGAGRSLLITGIVASAFASRPWKQFLILAVAVTALLMLGSRTYFVAGALSLFLCVAISAIRKRQHVALIMFLAVGAFLAYTARIFFEATRIGELLDISRSSSWQMRVTLQREAIEAILRNPLGGDFAYHIRELSAGSYAHNVLSAWPQFGMIGFVFYLALIATFALIAIRHAFSSNPTWQAALGLNVAALIVCMAEPVFSVVPALGWGFAVNGLLQDRAARRSMQLVRVPG
jgi:hypothetical protein